MGDEGHRRRGQRNARATTTQSSLLAGITASRGKIMASYPTYCKGDDKQAQRQGQRDPDSWQILRPGRHPPQQDHGEQHRPDHARVLVLTICCCQPSTLATSDHSPGWAGTDGSGRRVAEIAARPASR